MPPEVLSDLALIYLALLHSNEHALDRREAEAVADRLQSWQQTAPAESVVAAVGSAVAAFAGTGAASSVEAAIHRTRETLPTPERRAVLEDLVGLAMADDRFLYEESAFIGALAQAWEVHLTERDAEDDRKWSILNQDGGPGDWTPLHDLALLYIALAHGSDDDLATEEVAVITRKLNEWLPDAKEVDVFNLVQEAMSAYTQDAQPRAFADAVEAVRRYVPEHQRPALLSDLRHVAGADGVVLEREQFMIDQMARAWDMQVPQA